MTREEGETPPQELAVEMELAVLQVLQQEGFRRRAGVKEEGGSRMGEKCLWQQSCKLLILHRQ